MTKSVALKSVGCRTNQQEMTALGFRLTGAGYELSNRVDDADVVVVNTCCVTDRSEAKTRRAIRSIQKTSPGTRILVTGCMAQSRPDELAGTASVEWVVGNALKADIPGILSGSRGGRFLAPLDTVPVPLSRDVPLAPPSVSSRTRFPVKIQEGCDSSCAYCIVPSVRGRSRSVPSDAVVDLCRRALDAGYRELVITGTHIGQYRDPKGHSLHALLERILGIEGDYRIRLSSLDARDLDEGLLRFVEQEGRICDHLHVSVQSLCDDVLRRMGRPVEKTCELIERLSDLRRRNPSWALGGDFIVGFPGETDTMFDTTCRAVRNAGFTYGHVFRFSSRPGTAASSMREQVPHDERKRRSAHLISLFDDVNEAFLRSQIGRVARIIVERAGPVRGVTSNYIRVQAAGSSAPHNSWCDVLLAGTGGKARKHCTGSVVGS